MALSLDFGDIGPQGGAGPGNTSTWHLDLPGRTSTYLAAGACPGALALARGAGARGGGAAAPRGGAGPGSTSQRSRARGAARCARRARAPRAGTTSNRVLELERFIGLVSTDVVENLLK